MKLSIWFLFLAQFFVEVHSLAGWSFLYLAIIFALPRISYTISLSGGPFHVIFAIYVIQSYYLGGIDLFILISIFLFLFLTLFSLDNIKSFIRDDLIYLLVMMALFQYLGAIFFSDGIEDRNFVLGLIGLDVSRFSTPFASGPNTAAIIFALGFIMAFYDRSIGFLFKYSVLMLSAIGIIWCDSRSVMVGVFAAWLAMTLFKTQNARVCFVIVVNITAILVVIIFEAAGLSRAENVSVMSHRDAIWLSTYTWWQEQSIFHQLFGTGINAQVHSTLNETLSWFFRDRGIDNAVPTLHNSYFQFALDMGVIGGIILYRLLFGQISGEKYIALLVVIVSAAFYDNFLYITNLSVLMLVFFVHQAQESNMLSNIKQS